MGYTRHDAIVVVGSPLAVNAARAVAVSHGLIATDVHDTAVNGKRTFAVLPDGSKEGCPDSDQHEMGRTKLVQWMREVQWMRRWPSSSDPNLDEWPYLEWVCVNFGGDDEELLQVARGESYVRED